MSRPPGTTKPFVGDLDLCSIGAADFLESIGVDEGQALKFVAAFSFGNQVKPDEAARKKHRERLKEGWNLDSFELPCTVAGKVSTLRKKAARRIDESINHRTMIAAAHAIAAAHGNSNLREEMLSMLAKMSAGDAMLQNYILSLLASVTEDRSPPNFFRYIPAVVVAAADAKRKAKNANRMRQARAANGATPRTESISKKKPWERLGISRSTWYLKGKPA
jgi:hypothetical protein